MKRILHIMVGLSALFLASCKKELSDNFTTYTNHPLNDTVWVKNLLSTHSVNDLFDLLHPKELLVDSFNAINGGKLFFGDSLELEFKPNSLAGPGSSGTPLGNVRVELLPLRRKGDFVRVFKPTTTADGSLLETGGGFFIRVSKEGNELRLVTDSTFRIKFHDIDTAKADMQAFYGREAIPVPPKGIDTVFSWIRDFNTAFLPTWTKLSNNPLVPSYYGYELVSKNLRWVTASRYIDSSLPRVKVTAILSPNFTNKNTAVFIVVDGRKIIVNCKGDYASRSFFAKNIPLRSKIKLISLSKIGNDLYWDEKEINSVTLTTSYKLSPEKKSLKDILKELDEL
ncbi:MAG: hypothetical protein EPO58_07570 [Chitinophagaceae bacterium]|nr:MAG: hypothetical protein EPO58_07570 [Chitinophagaceae bacterium]